MTGKIITGSCLCGTVTYRFTGPSKVFQYCHCSRCRKITGATFGANIIVDPDQFEWLSGADHTGRYELPEASMRKTLRQRFPGAGRAGRRPRQGCSTQPGHPMTPRAATPAARQRWRLA